MKNNSAKFVCPNLFANLTLKFRKIYSDLPNHTNLFFFVNEKEILPGIRNSVSKALPGFLGVYC